MLEIELKMRKVNNFRILNQMQKTIKEEMPEWLSTIKRYDDQSITDMAEVWGLKDYDF